MNSRRHDADEAHPKTCNWILQHEKFMTWTRERRGLLWIKGKPGAGKSTLMAYIYRYFHEAHATEQDVHLSFFFTRRGTTLQQTPLGMLRSLLHQLYSQDSSVRRPIRQAFKEKSALGKVGEAWDWHLKELENLFRDAVLHVPSSREVVILMDALDEAGTEAAREIASYFHALNDQLSRTNGSTRICISCRHYPITATIPGLEVRVEENNGADISSFIRNKLQFIVEREEVSSDVNEWSDLEGDLLRKASGVFQWARLVVPLVIKYHSDGESLPYIRRQLLDVPEGLSAIYEHILKNVIEPRNRERALHLMQWICLAGRPLTITELRYAMASDDLNIHPLQNYCKYAKDFVESDTRMEKLVTSLSGGLAEVKQQEYSGRLIQLIHQSVNDFLISDGFRFLFGTVNESFRQGPEHAEGLCTNEIVGRSQRRLLRSCLNYLKLGEINLDEHRLLPGWLLEDKFPFINYATKFLFIHAEIAESHGISLCDLVQYFEGSEQLFKKWVQIYRKIDEYSSECPVDRTTLLQIASRSNLQSIISVILQSGADIEEQDSSGNRALHHSARRGHEKLTSMLLEKGAEAGAKNKFGSTPLIQAAGHGHGGVLKLLLERGASVNENSLESGNALQAACSKGSILLCQILIDNGAEVNAQGGQFGNALQAASYRGHEAVVRFLVDRGAEINAQGGHFGNALQGASFRGHEAVVRFLVDRGAEINAQGGHFGNALQAASCEGHEAVVRFLVDRGAEINAQGGEYGNALQAASCEGDEAVVRFLVDRGAEINAQGGEYGNALQAASCEGDEAVVRFLVDRGAEINAQGGQFGNALQAASYKGHEAVVRFLVDRGAEINAQGGEFGTALQTASYRGDEAVVRFLIDRGAE
jgi:ankyrin repeat protein